MSPQEKNFLRWVGCLQPAMDALAGGSTYTLRTPCAASGAIQRIREAIRYQEVHDLHGYISAATLKQMRGKYTIIANSEYEVLFRPQHRRGSIASFEEVPTSGPKTIEVSDPSDLTIHALCVLYHQAILPMPARIVVADPTHLKELAGQYNVSLLTNPDGSILLS